MPFYEFECKKCETKYDVMSSFSSLEEKAKKAKCPTCKSSSKKRVLTTSNVSFKQPEGTDLWNRSHDYRWKTKLSEIAKQKEKTPPPKVYNDIDDISSGKHFGDLE